MRNQTVFRSLKLSLAPRNWVALAIILLMILSVQPAAASSTVLYVLNGGTLSQTAGTGATTNSIPSAGGGNHDGTPTNPIIYTLSALNGTYDSTQSTAFSLYVDAGTAVGNGSQAQVQYDFTGDGTWDRTETYNYFATDPVAGFELYNQTKGLKSSSGTFSNLSNGKVRIQVWNAIGNAASTLRVSATSAQGQQSTVTIPFALGGGSPTNTPTNTVVGPTPTRTNTPIGPTPTRTNTPPPTNTSAPGCGSTNIALNKPATASSTENAGTPASAAVDGNTTTRWSSVFSDPQWIRVDLGTTTSICRVRLNWEAAYGKSYQIQTSPDGTTWTNIYTTTTGDGGIDDLTGLSGSGRYVRMNGTVRGTAFGYSLWEFEIYSGSGGPTPTNTPVGPTPTKTPTPSGGTPFWGDTASIPPASNVLMFHFVNRTNGQYPDSQIYWSFNGQTHSIAEMPNFDMPANSAGRMYFYLGSPTSQYNDFIEFTISSTVFNGNTTRVDWFGVKLAMRLHAHDGYDVSVGEDLATFQESRTTTFQKFVNEVPAEFDSLAQSQSPIRIPAPGKMGDTTFAAGGVNGHYFDSYAASVGVSASTQDIFGCAGTLATNAGMCSALNRHVAQLAQSQWTDSSLFYQAAPANYYAKFWHDHAINKLAYGFPYDDYGGYSSFISHGSPQWLVVAIGW
jgi:hypothetical protein